MNFFVENHFEEGGVASSSTSLSTGFSDKNPKIEEVVDN